MGRCYKYAIAQFATDPIRSECLNLGLVIFGDDDLEIKLPKSLDKLKAISAALDVETVRSAVEGLPAIDSFIRSQGCSDPLGRLRQLTAMSAFSFSSIGEFFASDVIHYHHSIDRLITKLVDPEPAPPKLVRRRASKLLADVKMAFKSEHVLARKGEGLEAHRIVPNHKVAEGLTADLLLQNGAMHVVQTVDASVDESSVRRMIGSIAVSALVFEQARMSFGEENTRARLVYKASSAVEALVTPSLEAAEHQGASLINWASRDDRNRFVIELSSLAEPSKRMRNSAADINASTQHKFRLN